MNNKTSSHLIIRVNKMFLLYIIGTLSCISSSYCHTTNKVLILYSNYTIKEEIDSLSQIIKLGGNVVDVIPIERLSSDALNNVRMVIYHRSDTTDVDKLESKLSECLIPYVENGGNLLLTMDGVRLLNCWNIEPQLLDVEYQDATDGGYGRPLGYHGYREHPIYEGLFGGAYVWKALEDHKARTIGFSGSHLPLAKGAKVLGVNWAYIHYHEDRKIIWETPIGKGKVLTIGGYLYFSKLNANRSTLFKFMDNVIDYLCESRKFKSRSKSWAYDSILVKKTVLSNFNIPLKGENSWKPGMSAMAKSQKTSQKNYWNVAGQQILAMGMETGNIKEIWIHPIMALRDMSVGIKYKTVDNVIWMDTRESYMVRCPEYLERNFLLNDNYHFKEIINVSPSQPLLAINYSWDDPNIEEVYISYTSNLRLMWPYSLNATGTLNYSIEQNGAVTAVFDSQRELNVMTVFDRKPILVKDGMYDFTNRNIVNFKQKIAQDKQVSFLYKFSGNEGKLNFYLSGGENGLNKTAKVLKGAIGNSQKIYKSSCKYYKDFNDKFLTIESDDSLFNMAYRWALISVDKFFAHTPSIGKSMMSGYCTTARGWNGGHKVSGRPGYAWYFGRDTEFTGIAMNNYGDYDKVKDILLTFGKYQDPDGKVYHELTTSGSVHYDASDSTPLYIVLAGNYLRKTGDIEFIKSQWKNLKKALSFCYSTDTDGDGLIENTNVGHGWQEGWQLHGAHTEVYLAAIWTQALKEIAYMASILGDQKLEESSCRDMLKCQKNINNNFWNDSIKFYNHGLMKDGTYQQQKCVLGGTPVMFGLADKDKAYETARNFSSKYYSTDWGVRMVGYNSPYYFLGGYNYGNIWPFHTGCAALAEYGAGLRFQGFRHAYGTLRLFDTWDYGNIAEVILGDKLEFTGICPHQQWSSSMNVLPLYVGMLGVKTDALKDSMTLSPAFPADWSYAHVKNIKVADKRVHMDYTRKDNCYRYVLKTDKNSSVNLNFSSILPLATNVEKVMINGISVPFSVKHEVQNVCVSIGSMVLEKEKEIFIHCNGGVAVLLNLKPLVNGMLDDGIKIEGEFYNKNTGAYTLKLAGLKGKSYEIGMYVQSEITDINGATLVKQNGNHYTFRIDIPKIGDEPFVDHSIELKIKDKNSN